MPKIKLKNTLSIRERMAERMYSEFINRYPVSKTLRFELIPQRKTLEHLERDGIVSEGEHRAKSYKKAKK